jgi:hypothetical protein
MENKQELKQILERIKLIRYKLKMSEKNRLLIERYKKAINWEHD